MAYEGTWALVVFNGLVFIFWKVHAMVELLPCLILTFIFPEIPANLVMGLHRTGCAINQTAAARHARVQLRHDVVRLKQVLKAQKILLDVKFKSDL